MNYLFGLLIILFLASAFSKAAKLAIICAIAIGILAIYSGVSPDIMPDNFF